MKERNDLPKVVEKSEEEMSEIIRMINESSLSEGIKEFILQCIQLAIWFPSLLQKKNISLNRLRRLLFGKGYKKERKRKSDNNSDDEETDTDRDKKAE